jgi:simple sugar transport system permease protein
MSGFTLVDGTLAAATPLIFAATGELVGEKAGVINLGIEGMMLVGAVAAFAAGASGWPIIVALLAAAFAAALLALLFAVLSLSLGANQYAAGLGLGILGSGVSAFIGHDYAGVSLKPIDPMLFGLDPLVYLALALAGATAWFLTRSKAGLVVRAVGESPRAAHDIGYPVIAIRYGATLFGGAMAGLGGAYLALCYTPLWIEDMTAGRGTIALALVVFAAWKPWRVVVGAWLFGGVALSGLFAQGLGVALPSELLSALPYVATILVLALARTGVLEVPASLGQTFHPEG